MDKTDFHSMLIYLSQYMKYKDDSPICAKDLLQLNSYLLDLEKGRDSLLVATQIELDKAQSALKMLSSRQPKYGGDLCSIDWGYTVRCMERIADRALGYESDE